MANASDERSPLLGNENRAPAYGDGVQAGGDSNRNSSAPVVTYDELPPPYTPSSQRGVPMVTCRVCGSFIDISGKQEQHVVKCPTCLEATPIKTAPLGKKYVRCPCNCLLICKAGSQRIACPRPNCKRVISLTPAPTTPIVDNVPGMCRIYCGHCHAVFTFNTLSNSLARCPHCRKVSSVGPGYTRRRGVCNLIIFAVFLIATVVYSVLITSKAHDKPALYLISAVLALLSIVFLIRSMYFLVMKVSFIEGPVQ